MGTFFSYHYSLPDYFCPGKKNQKPSDGIAAICFLLPPPINSTSKAPEDSLISKSLPRLAQKVKRQMSTSLTYAPVQGRKWRYWPFLSSLSSPRSRNQVIHCVLSRSIFKCKFTGQLQLNNDHLISLNPIKVTGISFRSLAPPNSWCLKSWCFIKILITGRPQLFWISLMGRTPVKPLKSLREVGVRKCSSLNHPIFYNFRKTKKKCV